MAEVYGVTVVVDPNFGLRLTEVARRGPVWIVKTDINRAAAEEYWRDLSSGSDQEGVTTFNVDQGQNPEDWFIGVLPTIDLHHGSYSHTPPYAKVDVIGVQLTSRLRKACSQFGFDDFEDTTEGFVARR